MERDIHLCTFVKDVKRLGNEVILHFIFDRSRLQTIIIDPTLEEELLPRLGNRGLDKLRDAILVSRFECHHVGELSRAEFASLDQRFEMHLIPEHEQRPIGDQGHRQRIGILFEHELHHQIHILTIRF